MTDQTQQPPQEQREYTVAELDQAVAAGQITQQQRDHMFASQVRSASIKEATNAARQVVETETRTNQLDSELKQYADFAPDVLKDGSPTRQRVASEYKYLVSKGAPENLTTELAAVRAALGPIERMRQFAEARRRDPEAFREMTGGNLTPQQKREADAFSRLSAAQQKHYSKLIDRGVYRDRAAVLTELNWQRGGNQNNRGRA